MIPYLVEEIHEPAPELNYHRELSIEISAPEQRDTVL